MVNRGVEVAGILGVERGLQNEILRGIVIGVGQPHRVLPNPDDSAGFVIFRGQGQHRRRFQIETHLAARFDQTLAVALNDDTEVVLSPKVAQKILVQRLRNG